MNDRQESNLKRRLVKGVARVLSEPIYITEDDDLYRNKIASVYYTPATAKYSVKTSQFVKRRNDYKELGITYFDTPDQVTAFIREFVGETE